MITSLGQTIGTSYEVLLPAHNFRLVTEIINKTTGTLYVVFGEALIDANAIEIPTGGSWSSPSPIASAVYAKAAVAGTVTTIANR